MGETKELSRRNFMQTAIWGIGGLIGIGFGVPAVAYVVGPSLKSQQTQTWMRSGSNLQGGVGYSYIIHLYNPNPNRLDRKCTRSFGVCAFYGWAHLYCHVEYLYPSGLSYPVDRRTKPILLPMP